MTTITRQPPRFDGDALVAEVDRRRAQDGLRWRGLAEVLWDQSIQLNLERADAPLCPGALLRTVQRGTMSCQYALTLLRWLGRPPEDFLDGEVVDVGPVELPTTDSAHRLRWNLGAVHESLDAARRARGLTWASLAAELDCTPSRLTNLRTARLADMALVMSVVQWLELPSSRFIEPADW